MEHFKNVFDTSLLGVLFYGSCLRNADSRRRDFCCSSIMDFHLLVDKYCCQGQRWWEAFLNRLLPPNVYNLNLCSDQKNIQSKYAVYPLKTFSRAVSKRWLNPYFWARFAQPTVIAYAKDYPTKKRIEQDLVKSLLTFVEQTLPLMQSPFSIREFWRIGLGASYATELRTESPRTISRLYDTNKIYLQRLTPLAYNLSRYNVYRATPNSYFEANLANKQKTRAAILWKTRRILGKWLAVLRLTKSSLTFNNSFEYIISKLERHSGEKIDVSPFCRKHPVLGSIFLAMRLYRKKIFR